MLTENKIQLCNYKIHMQIQIKRENLLTPFIVFACDHDNV